MSDITDQWPCGDEDESDGSSPCSPLGWISSLFRHTPPPEQTDSRPETPCPQEIPDRPITPTVAYPLVRVVQVPPSKKPNTSLPEEPKCFLRQCFVDNVLNPYMNTTEMEHLKSITDGEITKQQIRQFLVNERRRNWHKYLRIRYPTCSEERIARELEGLKNRE